VILWRKQFQVRLFALLVEFCDQHDGGRVWLKHGADLELSMCCSWTKYMVFVNNQLDAQFFFMYVYFCSLHVSGSHVSIIRRINCINTTSGICHSI
jgi:hypothetical protein